MKCKLLTSILLLLFSAVSAGDTKSYEGRYADEKFRGPGPSLEKIKANTQRRRQNWAKMLKTHEEIVAKHESGEKIVEEEAELAKSYKRIEQVRRKIKRIDSMTEEDYLKEQRKAYGRFNEWNELKEEL